MCNITKCCTEVCPEHIKITDNGIIPLKERVADIYFDPVMWAARKLTRAHKTQRCPPPCGSLTPSISRSIMKTTLPSTTIAHP